MAFLRIYEDGKLLQQVELSSETVTIGRSADNDVVLPGKGVSKLHATIKPSGPSYEIVDCDSVNGLYVNSEQVACHTLQYWDEIEIYDYVIKFMGSTRAKGEEVGAEDQVDDGQADMTMQVSVDDMRMLAELRATVNKPVLIHMERADKETRFELDNLLEFTIGRSRDCDVRLPSWFAPRQAAAIERRSEGYFLVPSRRGKVLLNGQEASDSTRLQDGDQLQVRGQRLRFEFRPVKKS